MLPRVHPTARLATVARVQVESKAVPCVSASRLLLPDAGVAVTFQSFGLGMCVKD